MLAMLENYWSKLGWEDQTIIRLQCSTLDYCCVIQAEVMQLSKYQNRWFEKREIIIQMFTITLEEIIITKFSDNPYEYQFRKEKVKPTILSHFFHHLALHSKSTEWSTFYSITDTYMFHLTVSNQGIHEHSISFNLYIYIIYI